MDIDRRIDAHMALNLITPPTFLIFLYCQQANLIKFDVLQENKAKLKQQCTQCHI